MFEPVSLVLDAGKRANQNLTFVAIGDWGYVGGAGRGDGGPAGTNQRMVADGMASVVQSIEASLGFLLGDNIYGYGLQTNGAGYGPDSEEGQGQAPVRSFPLLGQDREGVHEAALGETILEEIQRMIK